MNCISTIFTAIGLTFFNTVSLANEVTQFANGEWPPYMSQDLPYGGFASRIVYEAYALSGINIQYKWLPWKRALTEAEKGLVDGTVGWIFSKERDKKFLFSNPVFSQEMVFFHLKKYSFDWEKIEDLRNIKIGATIGYGDYGEAFIQAEASAVIKVERVRTDEQNFGKLLTGRIQVFPLAKEVGDYILKKKFKPQQAESITYNKKPIHIQKYYILFSKRKKNSLLLQQKFNEGLEVLIKSGKYQQYYYDMLRF